ncbi:hypothetical protein [Hymenobacter ruricola]|uniref:Uncharacterized protein n=1 Tax=Hymenobacter ruricola TaxID=2791023 RepID=A0ABS0I0Z3_9BACT|nr:hypothetical protein [Hymenobacter ruricola]MBF9220616.1 hypothetical protein [Hymenobacter ruricola]
MPVRLRFTGLLLLASFRLLAQDGAAVRPVRDSAYAVHNLFRERRGKGFSTTGYGMAGLTGTGFEIAQGQTGASVVLGLISLVPTALGARQYWRYSASRENAVVRLYEQGWPLPPEVRRRLRAKHFKALP